MKSFYEIQSSKEKKIYDFNVSQSLPRFLRTMGFVVLCLIFFLCEAGMDSRFQRRLSSHCFQGLFQRSHMGYCDECTLWGVLSEHTRNQRGAAHAQRCRPVLLGTVVFISHSLSAPDKRHRPESLVKLGGLGGGQERKTGLF